MSKTTQVKVKIVELIGGHILINYKNDTRHKIFISKFFQDNPEFLHSTFNFYDSYFVFMPRDGESRESIIKSLWDYQKSLLPEGYGMLQTVSGAVIITNPDNIPDEPIYFYDPAERIVTITRWDKED